MGESDLTPILDSKQSADYLSFHDYALGTTERTARELEESALEAESICSCPFCHQVVTSRTLSQHFTTHHLLRSPVHLDHATTSAPEVLTSITCILCSHDIPLQEVHRHVAEYHGNGSVHACEHCCRMFETQIELIRHLYTHIEPKLQCEKCPYKTRYQESFRLHNERFCAGRRRVVQTHTMRIIQTHLSNIYCAFCARRFGNLPRLVTHLQEEHVNDRCNVLFACVNCGVATKSSDFFRQHKLQCESEGFAGFRIQAEEIFTIDQNNRVVIARSNPLVQVDSEEILEEAE